VPVSSNNLNGLKIERNWGINKAPYDAICMIATRILLHIALFGERTEAIAVGWPSAYSMRISGSPILPVAAEMMK
jgi:hypothetical protein